MWDLAAKCWASLGTAGPSWSSQHCILGLIGHIFVAFCAQEQSWANKHGSSRCLHIFWQGRMSAQLPSSTLLPRDVETGFLGFSSLLSSPGTFSTSQTTLGCQASIQLMSSLCMLAWVRGRARGALHHSQPWLCVTGIGRRGIAGSQAELRGFSMQEKMEKKGNTAPDLHLIPAASLLLGWLNPRPSPALCHRTRTLGDTPAVSVGWEEMTAACPQQPPAYAAIRPGTQKSCGDVARSARPAREGTGR